MKTVEIVVEEKPWRSSKQLRNEDVVGVIVHFHEKAVRDQLRAAGGKWDPEEKVWNVTYGKIRGTELEEKILVRTGRRARGK